MRARHYRLRKNPYRRRLIRSSWRRNPIPGEASLNLPSPPDWLSLTPPSECPSCDEGTNPRWKVCPYCETDLISQDLKIAKWFRNIQVDIRSYGEKDNPVFIVMRDLGYDGNSEMSYHLSLGGALDSIRASVLEGHQHEFMRRAGAVAKDYNSKESELYFPYYIRVEALLP